jgi:hypothetical protein
LKKVQKISTTLTVIVIILSAIASIGGIFFDGLYQDNDFVNRVWLGNDIITLLLAIPIMIISLSLTIKGSFKATFIWLGTLWYMIYNYLFYSFGATFNKFFLLHIFIFIFSAYAFILGLSNLDLVWLKAKVTHNVKIPFKRISSYLLFFGVFIGGMWIAMSLNYVFTGHIPDGITQTGHSTAVVFAADLGFLVSLLIVGGSLLWHKHVWGYIISSFLMIKCMLYPLVLALGGFFAYQETHHYDPLTPSYIVLGIGCFICLWSLLHGIESSE